MSQSSNDITARLSALLQPGYRGQLISRGLDLLWAFPALLLAFIRRGMVEPERLTAELLGPP